MKRRIGILAVAAGVAFGVGCHRSESISQPEAEVVEAVNRGVSLMGQYDYAGAVDAFETARERDPDRHSIRIDLAIARFNRASQEEGDLERAEALLEGVLAEDPENDRALYFLAILRQHQGRAEAAIPLLEKVIRQRPNDGAAWYLLGLCRQRLGQPAEEPLQRAIELRPYLYSAYYKLAQEAMRRQDTEQGRALLEKFNEIRSCPLAESIELPQYNQMGELAEARPLPARNPAPISKNPYRAGNPRRIAKFPPTDNPTLSPQQLSHVTAPRLVAGDFNGDGRVDLIFAGGRAGADGIAELDYLQAAGDGVFTNRTVEAGLERREETFCLAVGDFDNDENLDLYVAGDGPNQLYRGRGDGTFELAGTGAEGPEGRTVRAVFLDADHDADLDLILCQAGGVEHSGSGIRLLNNNGDGSFRDITAESGLPLAGDDEQWIDVQHGDVDGDRDTDLFLFRREGTVQLFANDLLGHFSIATKAPQTQGNHGAILQDFNGDGQLDLLTLSQDPFSLDLWVGDGRGGFQPDPAIANLGPIVSSWSPFHGLRGEDLDLDGDLDVALFGESGHALLNDGSGRFVFQPEIWPKNLLPQGTTPLALFDLDGDRISDLVACSADSTELLVVPGRLELPPNAVAVLPTGVRSRDRRTRSPATGFGTRLRLRAGLIEQTVQYTGLDGGPGQSVLPAILGLGPQKRADYLHILWPDGVQQMESSLAAGTVHRITETERKLSSCPVLFTWNGVRFEFVTDFAGVGGLGYFVAPGEASPPQVREHIKIESPRLRPRNGSYELRVTEPMEETAYVDRLELLVVDHPEECSIFPDERLAIKGPPPTHEMLVIRDRHYPVTARDPQHHNCTENLLQIDRRYAYEPEKDRRYCGFCRPHTLELDFGDRLRNLQPTQRVFLFVHGFIEYPYSQTVYAAAQSDVHWQPIQIDRRQHGGEWTTVIPDAGVPGGMARMMTVDLTGKISAETRELRLTTNLEIYYDALFVAPLVAPTEVKVHTRMPANAELRRGGFALEYSPDGRLPMIYDYDLRSATAPFHVLSGSYTRYGEVTELLRDFDDRYVLVGPGDEIAVTYEAASLPPVKPGCQRSFILVSHAYCKDMDLYTSASQTLTPWPFRGMRRYPYASREQYPDRPALRAYHAQYNTRHQN